VLTLLLPAFGADNNRASIPALMLPATAGWGAGPRLQMNPADYLPDDYLSGEASVQRAIALGAAPDRTTQFLHARTLAEWIPPLTGIGPISDGPEYPYYNNLLGTLMRKNPTYRVADLNSAAAMNLMPWAIDALRKQNALVLMGKNGETRQSRCWETGVPDIHEDVQKLFIIQTPTEVIMYQGGRLRHIYLNVPHTLHAKLSWYGESIGHYEGDALVVDTIGLNASTFVDGYRTPHTAQEHVIERFAVRNGGMSLDISFTVDDPGAFYQPWGARRPRYRLDEPMTEVVCANGKDDRFDLGLDPVPHADIPDF
jgi:hypothetical protein